MDNTDKALAVELTNTFVAVSSEIQKPNGEQQYTFTADDIIGVLNKFYDAVKKLD